MFITVNYGPIEHAMYYSKIALEPKFIYPKYHKGYDYALGNETISCLLAYTQTSVLPMTQWKVYVLSIFHFRYWQKT